MGFETISASISRLGPEETKDKVYMALYKDGGVVFRVGVNIATKLGWQDGTFVSLAEGFGTDAGIVQLRATDEVHTGYRLLNEGKKDEPTTVLRIAVRHTKFKHHLLLNEGGTIPAHEVTFQTFGGTLTVMLPSWLAAKV